MSYNIFLAKESRANEGRAALIPKDIATLIERGHCVYVESHAGLSAGYDDKAYQAAGAKIVKINETQLSSYIDAFNKITMIVRAKRPNRTREKLEYQAMKPGTIMIGALDPLEKESNHVAEYHQANIIAYSLDQAILPATDPMNILAAMGRFAGELALKDALSKCQNDVKKVVIIGLGEVGKSVLSETIKLNLPVLTIIDSDKKVKTLERSNTDYCVVDKTLSLQEKQLKIGTLIADADIVITTARRAGQKAPLLIPQASLDIMKPGSVIVDMPISEGGNVHGSKHDETIKTDRNILITNVSGYPKLVPKKASLLWSKASLNFILNLAENPQSITLKPINTFHDEGLKI